VSDPERLECTAPEELQGVTPALDRRAPELGCEEAIDKRHEVVIRVIAFESHDAAQGCLRDDARADTRTLPVDQPDADPRSRLLVKKPQHAETELAAQKEHLHVNRRSRRAERSERHGQGGAVEENLDTTGMPPSAFLEVPLKRRPGVQRSERQ
jgi:hypothetical protein